jgi:hypothetical protein
LHYTRKNNELQNPARRMPLWDMAKGLSIFMVLFLHVRCYSSAFGKNVFLENFCWHSCIYIFFVASGYFSVRLLTDLSVLAHTGSIPKSNCRMVELSNGWDVLREKQGIDFVNDAEV